MEFKKKREKEHFIDESNLEKYPDNIIEKYLQSIYPIGCIVDQATAYDLDGSNSYRVTIHENNVTVQKPGSTTFATYTNITIGGTGVWNNSGDPNSRKLAKIVKE